MKSLKVSLLIVVICFTVSVYAQPPRGIHWSADGISYYEMAADGITRIQMPAFTKTVVVTTEQLTPKDSSHALKVRNFFFSDDGKKILIYTNSKKVWRYDTRGDYWVLNTADNSLKQIGKTLPASSLMYAKFSPGGNNAAYVSKHNLYVEDLNTNAIKQLTTDGTDRMINGTFDWVYEEEFGCRDGFRWSPDGSRLVFCGRTEATVDLWLCSNQARDVRRVYGGSAIEAEPSWSLDGAWIYFATWQEKNFRLARIRPDGKDFGFVSPEGTDCRCPILVSDDIGGQHG